VFRRRDRSGTPTGGGHGSPEIRAGGDAQEHIIMEALRDLRGTTVREVMTPRVDVVALAIPVSAEDVTRAVRETGHQCFPVYAEHLDDLVGVLFVNDLFRAGWRIGGGRQAGDGGGEKLDLDPVAISRRLRQPFLVPESRYVLDVLAEMRRQRRAFAVVVDEHGGVEGVLTVKDVLGALVGALPDEFDTDDEPDVVRVDGRRWLVDARMNVDDVRAALGVSLPDGEYVTLGGFCFDAFGHIPTEGESLRVDGWVLRIAEMDRRRVAKVIFERLEDGGDGGRHDGNGLPADGTGTVG
jgi:CBS domain containing-hemolysin-like protein